MAVFARWLNIVLVFHPNCYGLIFSYRFDFFLSHYGTCLDIDFPYRFHMWLDYCLLYSNPIVEYNRREVL